MTFNEEEPIKGKVIFKGGSCDLEVKYIELSLIERVNNQNEDSDFRNLIMNCISIKLINPS